MDGILSMMLEKQAQLQRRMGYDFTQMQAEEKVAYIKEYTLFTTDELHEMLHELPHLKPWKKYIEAPAMTQERFNRAQEEFIDAIHFVLNIALALGLSAEDMWQLYIAKHAVNNERQDNTVEYKPCVDRTE